MPTVGVIGASGLSRMKKSKELGDALKKIRRGKMVLRQGKTKKVDSLKQLLNQ